jgi:asparagine synthetase B (glutamine-hydrolysing)
MLKNTEGLKRSARRRSEGETERAQSAIQRMQADEVEINFRSVAAQAGVSTAWLYKTKALRATIMKARYPFLDKDLVNYLFSIPREQILRPGRRRSLMRRALANIVPHEVLERRRKAYQLRAPHRRIPDAECWGANRKGCEDCRMEYGDDGADGGPLRALHFE